MNQIHVKVDGGMPLVVALVTKENGEVRSRAIISPGSEASFGIDRGQGLFIAEHKPGVDEDDQGADEGAGEGDQGEGANDPAADPVPPVAAGADADPAPPVDPAPAPNTDAGNDAGKAEGNDSPAGG